MNFPSHPGKPDLRESVLLAMMGALMIATKVAMAALPNIHLVAVLILLCVISFGWKALYAVAIYVVLEGLLYGFGVWWICYIYVWPALAAVGMAVRNLQSAFVYAVVGFFAGLFFGALCAITYVFLFGSAYAFSWWLTGIPYDLIHGVSNGILCYFLLPPLSRLFGRFGYPSLPEKQRDAGRSS